MIPTLIILGLVFGRWWWIAPAGGVGWCLVLLGQGSVGITDLSLLGGFGFGVANTAVGVAVHQIVWRSIRLRDSDRISDGEYEADDQDDPEVGGRDDDR